jgi:hypothetical protein
MRERMLADLSQEHVKQFKARMQRWVAPSHVALRNRPDQLSKLHGLAAIDAELFLEEALIHERPSDPRYADPVQVARLLTLSELWVMGMYEFARRWAEEARDNLPEGSDHRVLVHSMRDALARVRMPMAKEKPTSRRKIEGDFGIAIPVAFTDGKVGWQVGPSAAIARVDLADDVICTLERLGSTNQQGTIQHSTDGARSSPPIQI